MARIMKVRTIPRGYVGVDDLKDFVHEKNGKRPAEWFMQLYSKFGNPQDGGLWSYLLRHDNIVMKVTAKDADTMDYDVWLAPGFLQDAKRKKTKAMNLIARRLNEEGVVFLTDDEDRLYYAVRRRNAELMEHMPMPKEDIRMAMDATLTDKERDALYGSIAQYLDGAKKVITETIGEIFDGKN
jgi:hypothetical protein